MRNIINNKAHTGHKNITKYYRVSEKEIIELLHTLKATLTSENFCETAGQIFKSCAKIIGAKAGYVAVLPDKGQDSELLLFEKNGLSRSVNPELPLAISELHEKVYETGEIICNNNFMKSEWVDFMPEKQFAFSNLLLIPLKNDKKTVGILGFACKEDHFTENDKKMAAAFGSYAATALQSYRTMGALVDSNKTKDKLFYIIAHDLKSPFSSLLGYSDLLVNEVSCINNQQIIDDSIMINETAKKFYEYLNNLLEWSRLNNNNIEFYPEVFNLSELIHEATDTLSLQAQHKKIKLNISFENEILVFADRNMIKIVLINLISNAIKFSGQGSEIIIWGEQYKKFYKIYVTDNGVGMNKEMQMNLFKVSKTFSTIGTNKERGTGLGLILCKDFINKHSGQMGVESNLGKGSTFWFSLPSKKYNRNITS